MEQLLSAILNAKIGDGEFILSRSDRGQWFAAIGNKSTVICIGEGLSYGDDNADFYAEGPTAFDALRNLLGKMSVPDEAMSHE